MSDTYRGGGGASTKVWISTVTKLVVLSKRGGERAVL